MLLEHQATLAPAGDDAGRYPVRLGVADGLVVLDSAPARAAPLRRPAGRGYRFRCWPAASTSGWSMAVWPC